VLAALIVVPFGQPSIAWFSSIAFVAIVVLWADRRVVPAADSRPQESRSRAATRIIRIPGA